MYKLNIKEVTDNKTFIHSLIRVSESLSSKNYQKKPLNPVKVVNYNHGVNESFDLSNKNLKSEIFELNKSLNNSDSSLAYVCDCEFLFDGLEFINFRKLFYDSHLSPNHSLQVKDNMTEMKSRIIIILDKPRPFVTSQTL